MRTITTPPLVAMRGRQARIVVDKKLQPFCGTNERYYLGTPFWVEGHVCATDGKIALRYAANSPMPSTTPPAGFKVPRMAELPWKDDAQCNHPWPTSKELSGKDRETVLIAGRKIGIPYACKVAGLGEVYFCPSGSHDDALAFATSKLEGLLMPLCKD